MSGAARPNHTPADTTKLTETSTTTEATSPARWDDYFRLLPPRPVSEKDIDKVASHNHSTLPQLQMILLIFCVFPMLLFIRLLPFYPWNLPAFLMKAGFAAEAEAVITSISPTDQTTRDSLRIYAISMLMESGPRAGRTIQCYADGTAALPSGYTPDFIIAEAEKTAHVKATYCTLMPGYAVTDQARPEKDPTSVATLLIPLFSLTMALWLHTLHSRFRRRIRAALRHGTTGEAELISIQEEMLGDKSGRAQAQATCFFACPRGERKFHFFVDIAMARYLQHKQRQSQKIRIIYDPRTRKKPFLAEGMFFSPPTQPAKEPHV